MLSAGLARRSPRTVRSNGAARVRQAVTLTSSGLDAGSTPACSTTRKEVIAMPNDEDVRAAII